MFATKRCLHQNFPDGRFTYVPHFCSYVAIIGTYVCFSSVQAWKILRNRCFSSSVQEEKFLGIISSCKLEKNAYRTSFNLVMLIQAQYRSFYLQFECMRVLVTLDIFLFTLPWLRCIRYYFFHSCWPHSTKVIFFLWKMIFYHSIYVHFSCSRAKHSSSSSTC